MTASIFFCFFLHFYFVSFFRQLELTKKSLFAQKQIDGSQIINIFVTS